MMRRAPSCDITHAGLAMLFNEPFERCQSGAASFEPGHVIDGYRLISKVGHGGKAIVYRAVERRTGIPVALKVLHATDRATLKQARLTARCFHRLRHTGAVPAFHLMGRAWLPNRKRAVYLVFDFLAGEPLAHRLMGKHWNESWSEPQAFLMLWRLAGRIAAIHAHGLAIVDFAHGNNIMLMGRSAPLLCDLSGHQTADNRHVATDIEVFGGIALELARIEPLSERFHQIALLSEQFRQRTPDRRSMTALTAAIATLR